MAVYPRVRDVQVNVRLIESDKALLDRLAEHYGLSLTGLLEMLIRDKAREAGVRARRKTG